MGLAEMPMMHQFPPFSAIAPSAVPRTRTALFAKGDALIDRPVHRDAAAFVRL
jgi:hypothetical protein